MCTFKNFLRWYNNKNVVPALEAMQKKDDFYQIEGFGKLKLGFSLPNLAIICLHNSTTAKFCLFTERDKLLTEKNCEDLVGGPANVFSGKSVVDENSVRNSANFCKIIVGKDASQPYPFSM